MSPTLVSRILVCWSALGVFLILATAMIAPVILVGTLVAPLLLCDRRVFMSEVKRVRPITAVLFLTATYLLINASWSLDMKNAYISVAMIFVVAIVSQVGVSALLATKQEHLQAMRRGMVIGIALGALFLSFEYVTKLSTLRALRDLQASAKLSIVRINTDTADYGPLMFIMNRNLVALVMMIWIACLIQVRLDPSQRGRIIMLGLFALAAFATFKSPSATAKIGLLTGTAVFLLHYVMPRLVLPLVTAAWVGLCVLALPLANFLYQPFFYNASWIVGSARHRLLIWGATADWYWKAPWLGAGVGSARNMEPLDPAHRVDAVGLKDVALNWHAHNAYVQVWFEAGMVGIVFFLTIGLMILRAISRVDASDRPALTAAFAGSMVMAATAFSIWAAWYIAAFGLTSMFAILAIHRSGQSTAPV